MSEGFFVFVAIVCALFIGFLGGGSCIANADIERVNTQFCTPLCTANETPSASLDEKSNKFVCTCTSVRTGVEK